MTSIGTKHKTIRFSRYQQIHSTVIEQYKARDFIDSETLEFRPAAYGIMLQGEIGCLGNLVIGVEKFLDVSEPSKGAMVQTRWYSYNVFVRNRYNVFRYDNQDDDYLRQGHQDEHHKHIFDWRTGEESPDSPIWVGFNGWLTLGEVIQEVEDWYWQHRNELPDCDSYPELGTR